ncbi:hypothetical protein H110_05108 [Trichophyton rubrum MR1448]|nr:hypothetical protein H110_05108 [Trichophyton rubrum MR1448]
MATQGGLNAEFRSERRLQLLTTLQSLLDERQPNGLPSSSWAGLWLADLERLEEIIASAGRAEFIPAITADFGVIVREKAQRERFESRSPSSSPPQSPSGLLRASPSQSSSLHRSAVEKRSGLTREPPGDEAEQPTSQPAIPPAKRQCTGSELSNSTGCHCRSLPEILASLSGAADVFPDTIDDDDSSGILWEDGDSIRCHDSVASLSDPGIEPSSLSPQTTKVASTMSSAIHSQVHKQSLA